MSYAQINYSQKQGVLSPKGNYTIAQIGCFITAFCNLLERFGRQVDPPGLDNWLKTHGGYTDIDDGVFDDVGWGSISAYAPDVVVVRTGTGAPPADNCIVKVVYQSGGKTITHFCLVANAAKGLILDSWDGRVKSWDVYGGVKAWAMYNKVNAQAPTVNSGGQAVAEATISTLRILQTEVAGSDLTYVHSGQFDDKLRAAYAGQDADTVAYKFWLGGAAWREYRVKCIGFYEAYKDMPAQIAELQKRPSQENFDELVKQLKIAQDKLTDTDKKLETAQATIAADQAAGDAWSRRLGQWIKKFIPGL